ncbi:MAG: hypothetical protein IKP86_01045 [Anaerolineaceae bacterium]|nr:hypothetical protein [Anaerolineaceae bacterium]
MKKITPYLLILFGGARLLYERFPQRLSFLRIPGGDTCGWIFWLAGITGLVWLLLSQIHLSPERSVEMGSATGGLQGFFRRYGIEVLILFLTAASLSMLIRSGYYWDDAVNSTAYLAEKKDSVSTLTHVLDFMKEYLHLGRVNLLSIYYYFFFYIENVSVYKALIILSILADQLIFRRTLLEFDVPLSGARLGMLLIPLMLQTRTYQDPVSGFYSLMQVLTAEMLLCALFLRRWMKGGKKRFLVLSLLMFAIGLLTYEVCFPFLLMICLLILTERKNLVKAIRSSLPFIGVTALILLCIYLSRKFFFSVAYSGVAFNPDPARILRAGLTQFAAGLPLSYYTAGYQASVMGNTYPANTLMNYDFLSFLKSVKLSDLLILAVCLWVLFMIRNREPESIRNNISLPVLGASFAILPVITIAVSDRYQGQLMPGLGYLPVYMQYYGIAVLLIWLGQRLRTSTGMRAFCLSAFSLILLLNIQNNRAVTRIMNRSFYEPRAAGEAALHGGLLNFLPEDAILVSVNDRRWLWEADWNNKGLYQEFYGNNSRNLRVPVGDNSLLEDAVRQAISRGASPDPDRSVQLETENIWIVDYDGNRDRGFARLGRLRKAEIDPDTLELRAAETDRILYFVSGAFPEQADVQYTRADGTFIKPERNGQLRVRQSADGILFQLPESELIIFDSLSVSH